MSKMSFRKNSKDSKRNKIWRQYFQPSLHKAHEKNVFIKSKYKIELSPFCPILKHNIDELSLW